MALKASTSYAFPGIIGSKMNAFDVDVEVVSRLNSFSTDCYLFLATMALKAATADAFIHLIRTRLLPVPVAGSER